MNKLVTVVSYMPKCTYSYERVNAGIIEVVLFELCGFRGYILNLAIF